MTEPSVGGLLESLISKTKVPLKDVVSKLDSHAFALKDVTCFPSYALLHYYRPMPRAQLNAVIIAHWPYSFFLDNISRYYQKLQDAQKRADDSGTLVEPSFFTEFFTLPKVQELIVDQVILSTPAAGTRMEIVVGALRHLDTYLTDFIDASGNSAFLLRH